MEVVFVINFMSNNEDAARKNVTLLLSKMNISKVGHLTSPLIDKKAWEKFNPYKHTF